MADKNLRPARRQLPCFLVRHQVRTGDAITKMEQMRQAAHAAAANTHEEHRPSGVRPSKARPSVVSSTP